MSKMYNLYCQAFLRTRQDTAKHSASSLCRLYVLDTVAVSFLYAAHILSVNSEKR